MIDYSPDTRLYISLWNKYRPPLLKLMIDAANGPQQYKFSGHEFQRMNPKEKGGYGFTLQVFLGKAVNNIRSLPVAKDLLEMLRDSKKASELVKAFPYEFVLDKHFVLHVTRTEHINVPVKETDVPAEV